MAAALGFFAAAFSQRTASAQTAAAGGGEDPARSESPTGDNNRAKAAVSAEPAPVAPAGRRWYGYQLMLSDVGFLATALALSHTNGEIAAVVGAGGFLVVPIAVHVEHRNTNKAFTSLLLRTILPIFGAVVGGGLETCSPGEWFCGLGGALVGGGVGMLTAMTIDYALANENVPGPAAHAPAADASPPSRHADRFTVTAAGLAPTKDGAAIVFGGRF